MAMTTRTRRTPEELAAYHMGKANRARAKAAKAKKAAEQRLSYELSRAAQEEGIASAEDLKAYVVLGKLMIRAFGPGGTLHAGSTFHWDAVTKLFKLEGEDRERLYTWWTAQGFPMGPDQEG